MRCHDPHAGGAYRAARSGIAPPLPAGVPGIPSGIFETAFPAWFPPFEPSSFRSPRRRPAGAADPDSRVSRAGARARLGARIAAARLARLIARARRRTHFSRQLLRGFFAPARTGKGGGPARTPPPCLRPHIGRSFPESKGNLRIISDFSNEQQLMPGERRSEPVPAAAGTLLPRLRAKPGKEPSRREACPRPLPPSGRGAQRSTPGHGFCIALLGMIPTASDCDSWEMASTVTPARRPG